ncbi:MAG: peptidoglycan-binding protein [Phyllobacteriaceae bacterium]|jgi:peptidoglycan hydrolase-like protein with peptidoglycan-binding domain|nr:peptidoglycan-binding protein [Phyllobacteriaceae bacterium]
MRRNDMADGDDRDSVLGELAEGLWHAALRNRRAVTAALGIFGIVTYASVNALYLQDGAHPSAFFETRDTLADRRHALRGDERSTGVARPDAAPVTRIVFDESGAETPAPGAVPATRPAAEGTAPTVLEQVVQAPVAAPQAPTPTVELQTMLADLGFYDAAVDGIAGPRTEAAIEAYKTSVGLRGIELSTDELLTSLRNNMVVTAAIPRQRPATPAPQAEPAPAAAPVMPEQDRVGEAVRAPVADPDVLRVQAGLKAFGNDDIRVDGVAGEQTRMAVREFQALFRMPVTGEIDTALLDKMVAVGLID